MWIGADTRHGLSQLSPVEAFMTAVKSDPGCHRGVVTIVVIRGSRVILAADLAGIYGVQTRALNQAVKRNLEKFPEDFIFQLTLEEAETVQRSRSQIVILKRGLNIKYLPYAFTEHGAIVAANALNSPRTVAVIGTERAGLRSGIGKRKSI